MDMLFKLVDIAVFIFGCYAMYAGYVLKKNNIVSRQVLLSKDMEFKKCRDIEGYKGFMVKRIFGCSAIIIILGGLNVADDFSLISLGTISRFIFIPLLFAILWFALFSSKGQKTYFE